MSPRDRMGTNDSVTLYEDDNNNTWKRFMELNGAQPANLEGTTEEYYRHEETMVEYSFHITIKLLLGALMANQSRIMNCLQRYNNINFG